VVNSLSSLFFGVNQSALATHNWGLDLCGVVPCELPWEMVCDAIAMSVTSHNSVTAARMWDNSQELPVHEWPLVPLANYSKDDDLVEPLAVDFSCFHSPSNSYSIEDVWDGQNIRPQNVSKSVDPNLRALRLVLGWPSPIMSMRLFSYYLESTRTMLCLSQVCREDRLLLEAKGASKTQVWS